MKKSKSTRGTRAFEEALAAVPSVRCILRLYVAGASERSQEAVLRARRLCASEFGDDFELEVIDVYQQPSLARDRQIIATPTLVRELPRPVRRLIGNLSKATGLFADSDPHTHRGAMA